MNKNLKRRLTQTISVTVLTAMALGFVPNLASAEDTNKLLNAPLTVEAKEKILNDLTSIVKDKNVILNKDEDPNELIRVIVELKAPSAQEKVGKGEKAKQEDIAEVSNGQEEIKKVVENITGMEVKHSYTNVFNGFSTAIYRRDIPKIEQIDGVSKVVEVEKFKENMNTAKALTGVEEAWKNYSCKGEGMVVAIIDTGIDYNDKDFASPSNKEKMKLNKEKVEKIENTGVLKADISGQTYFSEKIPFGYNYADKNNDIVDRRDSKSPHGCHVAGIVAADGDENEIKNNNAIKGVAPEAQLLAMKVFSNGPLGKYTYSDDQLAAIDDAVALGADVINMSLGASAGFKDETDPVQDAIKRATDAGVMVVVSAGNSSYSTSPLGDNLSNLNDQITVGSPALAEDALMVASYENTFVTAKSLSFKDEKGTNVAEGTMKDHQIDFEKIYNKNYEIVDCGVGTEEQLKKANVKNKIALIKRGEITFIEKILNAQKCGAVGVIVYNKDGDEGLISMATDDNIKIPAIFIGNKTGETIIENLNKKVKVLFNGNIKNKREENGSSGDFSDFTSWGPAPNLEFKPQISAPGGQIFSTLNNNEHGVMSGTSMAAPNIAGSMALLLESINKYNPELKNRELMDYAKNIMMNTSLVEFDKSTKGILPYSPRRQGAGLVQVEDAIRNRVTATNNGKASVELKEIQGNSVTFSIDLKNYGDKAVKYNVESIGGILTQDEKGSSNGMLRDRVLNDNEAKISFDNNVVKVPAKGEAKVNVTIEIGNLKSNKYVEGFIGFKSLDKNVPSLNVPYLGFYGNWSEESIATNNAWENEKHPVVKVLQEANLYPNLICENILGTEIGEGEEKHEALLGVVGTNEDGSLKYDKEKIAISPNGNKFNDVVYPGLFLLRNAGKVTGEILDSDGNVIRTVGTVENVRKKILQDELLKEKDKQSPSILRELAWDGKVYDKQTGEFVPVKEGDYIYRVKLTSPMENAKEQIIDMPVKVDLTEPSVQITTFKRLDDNTVKVYFMANDDQSKLQEDGVFVVAINGELNEEATKAKVEYDPKTKTYSKVIKGVPEDTPTSVGIGAFDYANNLGTTNVVIPFGSTQPAVIKFNDANFEKGSIESNKGKYTISGTINRKIKELIIDGEKVKLNPDKFGTYTFTETVKLEEGINTINIKAIDLDDKVIQDHGYKIYNDTIAPVIKIDSPNVSKDNEILVNGNEFDLNGVVSDNAFGYTFSVNGTVEKIVDFSVPVGPEKNSYKFSLHFKDVNEGDIITLKAVDITGNTTELKLKVIK